MIDDLWTYARISKPNFQKEDFSTEDAVTEAVASLGDAAKTSVITHGILPTINGNKAHFVHMFKELISNGIKYNNNATPQIHIDAHRQDDGWAFTVKDNGIGIDKVYARDVFKMFQRISGEPESSATGMGLTIAKKIVTQHYGRIWFDSDFGLGTTFTVWIPG
jgi:light-regulated signal transduction histidine kinase (bacteriophytochrome)